MYRVDDPTAVAVMPAPAAPGTPGYYTDGNPNTATPATIVRADHLNAIQEELMAILAAAGIAPAKGTNNQVLTAIQALISAGAQRSFKNKLINGAMEIDQRHEGAAVALASGTPQYIVDGWSVSYVSAAGGVIAQRVADAPAGFKNSLKISIGAAAGAVAAGDALRITQTIEGQDLIDLGFGNAGALPVSLQGQFKSSIAGTYSIALQNAAGTRSLVTTVAVAAPNAWTAWQIPNIPGDLAGAWATDNTAGLRLIITVAAGATAQTNTLNAWQASGAFAANTQTSAHLTTGGATFQVTGVQLEPNTLCTPFERAPVASELARCQRRFNKSYAQGTVAGTATSSGVVATVSVAAAGSGETLISIFFPVEMRAAPTMTYYSPSTGASGNWRYGAADGPVGNFSSPSTRIATVQNTASISSNSQFNGHYTADAEFTAV